ncbi:MAG TPA: sulfatase [Kofleriaceae bacterium]|nr:sulfatase [Kofleriaceae bacterium]
MSLVPLPGPARREKPRPARQVDGDVGAGAMVPGAAAEVVATAGSTRRPDRPALPAAADGAAHPVFDLADNRLLAHWYTGGGLEVTAGSPGFARYAQPGKLGTHRSGWQLGERQDQVAVALLRHSAALNVPLDDAPRGAGQGAAGAIAIRLYSRRRAHLSVALGGGAAIDAELARGWQVVSIPVPAADWREGENTVHLALRGISEVAVDWLHIGGAPPASGPDAARPTSFFAPSDGSLRLGAGEQLVYYFYVPESASLTGELVGDGPDAAGCRLVVRARAHLAAVDGELSAARRRVDLDALAGRVARVGLELRGCQRARLRRGSLILPGPAPVLRRVPPPRHIVLWIMDTLRADRIRLIRPGARPQVPTFERMAAEGAVFRNVYVQGNESNTSHASVWTSLYPAVHRVRTAGVGGTWRLSSSFTTIGEQARKAGLYVSGVTANGMITPAGGYARGFNSFINMMREAHPDRRNGWIPAERIVDRALGTLEGREKQPFFLFVGTIDTHKPWVGHEPWLSQYDPDEYEGPFLYAARARDLGIKRGSMRCTRTPGERDLERINAIYDSDVSYQDRVLGQFLDKLDRWGIADETMVIVTADHGEELWEDGRCGHGASLRETLVHVPLFVRYPPLVPGGTVIEQGVDALDVMPTVADALGLDPPSPSQGSSLVPLIQGVGRGYPGPAYASQYEYAHTMRVGSWKIWLTRAGGLKLYDLSADPGEHKAVAGRPIEARYMIDLLYLFLANRDVWNKREWGVVNNMTAAAPAALERAHQRGGKKRR